MSDAQNYCRNPDVKLEGPWCFVDDPFVEWDFCDIAACDGKDFLNLSAFQFLFSVGKIQLLMKIIVNNNLAPNVSGIVPIIRYR